MISEGEALDPITIDGDLVLSYECSNFYGTKFYRVTRGNEVVYRVVRYPYWRGSQARVEYRIDGRIEAFDTLEGLVNGLRTIEARKRYEAQQYLEAEG